MEAAMATGTVDTADRAATLEQLVDAYGDGVLQLAYLYVKDRGLAEDIFQEVFTKVYTRLDQFRGESSVKTWIYRITVNLCRDKLRAWSLRRVLLLGEEALLRDPGPDIAEEALAAVDRAALLRLVMQLRVEYREAVLLYYFEEMDSTEVARALGLSEGTVRSRLFRARAKLKQMLVEGGFVDERA